MPQDQDDIKGADAMKQAPTAPVEASGSEREGESVAIMRPFWVSWWGEPGTFELHRPWWISGERDDGKPSICAAVLAQDEFTARLSVQWAHDDKDAIIEWRFSEEKPKGWSPFGDRFRQADWMIWPEVVRPQPSWSEEVQTADTTHSRRLFFGDPGSPQPSGETQEIAWKILEEIPAINDLGSQFQEDIQAAIVTALEYSLQSQPSGVLGWFSGLARKEGHHVQADWLDSYIASIRPAPVASGGQHSSGEGRSHPTGNQIADAVIAGFLHGVGRAPWDDMHDYIAVCASDFAKGEALPARAEAPAAETAGEAVAWRVRRLSDDPEEWQFRPAGAALDFGNPKRWEIQPLYAARVPAQDDDKLRADRYYEALVQADLKIRSLPGTDQSDVAFIRAALKSTAAQEGGE